MRHLRSQFILITATTFAMLAAGCVAPTRSHQSLARDKEAWLPFLQRGDYPERLGLVMQQVFADQFTSQCGGTVTSQNAMAVGDTDFHPLLTTIAAEAPAMIFMPIFVPIAPQRKAFF